MISMTFKMTVTIMIIIGQTLLPIGYIDYSKTNNVLGNWKSLKTNLGPKYHTELFIDEETFNVFSEEVNDITFSSYYKLTKGEILILNESKKDVKLCFKYVVSGNDLIISGEEMSTTYTKVLEGKTMDDYIKGIISKVEYISEFNKRKQ